MEEKEYQQILEKYKLKIKKELGREVKVTPGVVSAEYQQFKAEIYPKRYTFYEKACNFSEKLLRFKANPKKAAELQTNIELCHLQITPSGVIAFSILAPLILMVLGSLIFFGIFQMYFFVIFFIFAASSLIPVLQKLPIFIGNTWRMKASNQMVQGIFYLVTYMKHTSNLERAVEFASDHLSPPLSLDFKKVLWDIETEKYPSIKDSFEAYLEQWNEWDKEFVEAAHLVESSLYESSEDRRLALLDKSLDVVLTGTYEKMLHYAHNLKSPMTMLFMLGIILPILGLVILPLVVSFMSGKETSPLLMLVYIVMLYNVSLPIGVFYLGKIILSKRPTGYGDTDISEQNPELKKYKNILIPLGKNLEIKINPIYFCLVIFLILLLIGLSPLIIHSLGLGDINFDEEGNFKLLGYVCPTSNINCGPEEEVGPYGLGASLLSLVVIAGLGVSLGLYYKLRSKNVYKIREQTRKLEDEFASALFQLGNRLGDGLPAEIAFAKVAENMQATTSGEFFSLIEKNITRLGMGIKEAIFDPKIGALAYFPSKVIESSMKVLIESIKKGPKIAAQALLAMSRYIKEIHSVDERLKDLMADTVSSMNSEIKFLTPAISGIVVGITSMVSAILTSLTAQLVKFSSTGGAGMGGWEGMLDIFGIGIPTFYFQLAVGVYIVQIVFILTILANGIENGADKLGERFALGRNLTRSTLLYCFISGMVILMFNLFAQTVMRNSLGT